MPHLTGLEALEIVRESAKDVPFVLVSGSIGEQLAVQAMKAGAQDYLMKDNLARLGVAVSREMQEARDRTKRREAEAELKEKSKQWRQPSAWRRLVASPAESRTISTT
jgi:DNA-binding NtrC family response regulator